MKEATAVVTGAAGAGSSWLGPEEWRRTGRGPERLRGVRAAGEVEVLGLMHTWSQGWASTPRFGVQLLREKSGICLRVPAAHPPWDLLVEGWDPHRLCPLPHTHTHTLISFAVCYFGRRVSTPDSKLQCHL